MQGLSHAGDPTGVGLTWIQLGEPDGPSVILEKTGGGAGFTTYIALSPGRDTGIFFAVTEGKGAGHIDFFHESNNLLAALANVPPLPPEAHHAPAKNAVTGRVPRPDPELVTAPPSLAGPQTLPQPQTDVARRAPGGLPGRRIP